MNQAKALRKIVWAVDPLADEGGYILSTAKMIAALTQETPASVQPVFVRVGSTPAKIKEAMPELASQLRKYAQSALDAKMGRVKIPDLCPLQVLRNEEASLRSAAKLVVEHARDLGAEMIVLSSHGRKGVSRAILGSFAETLSLYSDIPLVIGHPAERAAPQFREVLFLTDFSKESQAAFEQLLDFAEPHGARMAVLHKVGVPAYPAFELGHAFYAAYEKALDREQVEAAQMGKKLAKLARARGLKAEVIIDRTPGTVAASACKLAKRRRAMIALAARSGPVSSVLLGNTTWKIIRESTQPVWVMHPQRSTSVRSSATKARDTMSARGRDRKSASEASARIVF